MVGVGVGVGVGEGEGLEGDEEGGAGFRPGCGDGSCTTEYWGSDEPEG